MKWDHLEAVKRRQGNLLQFFQEETETEEEETEEETETEYEGSVIIEGEEWIEERQSGDGEVTKDRVILTHSGLVMPCGIIELGQYCIR